jgi:hypothetical protein
MALVHGSRLWRLGAARVVSLLIVRRRASADGSLRPIDDKIAIFAFMAALHNVQIWYSPDGRLSGAEIAERMGDILIVWDDVRFRDLGWGYQTLAELRATNQVDG